jgi:DNA-binding LacI/PurR family transcriptional regulator
MKRSPKAGSPPKVDIRGVASHARVSIATVSRTINHLPSVDPILAARVWKAVADLNYFPNTQARALVSGKSKLLGLIVSEITNPFFPELIQEFESVAVACGYEILIGSTNYDRAKMELCARRMLERKVDGVAIMTFGFEEVLLDRFHAEDIPVIFMDVASQQPRSTHITVDYRAGIHQAVQHLADLGHRHIAFISGPLQLRSAETRRNAFVECMREAGLTVQPSWVIEGTHTLDGGRDAMQQLLALPAWPTAILCSNDLTAIGVQHALFEARLKVPDDFSLVGFDDVHLAEYTIPPLTTVRMSCKDLAQAAVTNLIANMGTPAQSDAAPAATLIPTRLIVRQTTASPKPGAVALKPDRRKNRG